MNINLSSNEALLSMKKEGRTSEPEKNMFEATAAKIKVETLI